MHWYVDDIWYYQSNASHQWYMLIYKTYCKCSGSGAPQRTWTRKSSTTHQLAILFLIFTCNWLVPLQPCSIATFSKILIAKLARNCASSILRIADNDLVRNYLEYCLQISPYQKMYFSTWNIKAISMSKWH